MRLSKRLSTALLAGAMLFPAYVATQTKADVKKPNIAVMVIDMQDEFLMDIDEKELSKEIAYQKEVIKHAKDNNLPVYVVEYGKEPTTSRLSFEGVKDLNHFTKYREGAFSHTNLAHQLKAKNIDTIVLMGVNASACVLETAKGAVANNFTIMTSKDVIEDAMWFSKNNESIDWYKANGKYHDTYTALLKAMEYNR